jgi:hypothetical protein
MDECNSNPLLYYFIAIVYNFSLNEDTVYFSVLFFQSHYVTQADLELFFNFHPLSLLPLVQFLVAVIMLS